MIRLYHRMDCPHCTGIGDSLEELEGLVEMWHTFQSHTCLCID